MGSGGLGAGEVQGVEWFLTMADEFVGAISNSAGDGDRMAGEMQAAIDPEPADGKRTAAVFERVNRRGDEFRLASLDQAQHQTERERFEPDARLFLIVEWTIENAGVEIQAHSLRLRD